MSTNNYNIDDGEIFGGGEFIYYNHVGEDGKSVIVSGGYEVGSKLLNAGHPPIVTLNNNEEQHGGESKVSDLFQYLAVPAGLFYSNQRGGAILDEEVKYKQHDVIDDDIFDKLLSFVQENNNKRKKPTRRVKDKQNDIKNDIKNKKTRKRL